MPGETGPLHLNKVTKSLELPGVASEQDLPRLCACPALHLNKVAGSLELSALHLNRICRVCECVRRCI